MKLRIDRKDFCVRQGDEVYLSKTADKSEAGARVREAGSLTRAGEPGHPACLAGSNPV
jgi:hypothetical protein